MKLYLVRHGETDWNVEGRIMGQQDIPLNAHGIAQAEATRDTIQAQNLRFDAILCSPLQRTRQTAEIIAQGKQPITLDDRLKERNVGEFAGRPASELFNHEIDFLDPELNAGNYGVEPILAFEVRARDFLADLRENYPADANILVVSSNGLMKRLASIILDVNPEQVPHFDNAQIYQRIRQ